MTTDPARDDYEIQTPEIDRLRRRAINYLRFVAGVGLGWLLWGPSC
jgi:hypothetical protein